MISAENKHRKLRVTAIECSPELSKLGLRWQFYRKVLHHEQGYFNNTSHFKSTAKYLHITSYNIPLAVAIESLKRAKLDYLRFKKQHSTLRDKSINSIPERIKS